MLDIIGTYQKDHDTGVSWTVTSATKVLADDDRICLGAEEWLQGWCFVRRVHEDMAQR